MSNNKKRKVIIVVSISLIALAAIAAGIGIFFFLKNNKKQEQPFISDIQITKKFPVSENAKLRSLMVDVGQGDCSLIQVAANGDFTQKDQTYNILIDSGEESQSSNSSTVVGTWNEGRNDYIVGEINTPSYKQKLKWTLESYLVSNGSRDLIDMFIFTHADSDHIGAGDDVINEWCKPNESRVISFANNNKTTKVWKNTLEAIVLNDLYYLDPFLSNALDTPTFKDIFSTSSTYYDNGKWTTTHMADIEPNTILVEFGTNKWFSYLCPSFDYKTSGNGLNEVNESSINNFLRWNNYSFLYTGDSTGKTHTDVIDVMKQFPDFYKNNKGNYAVSFYKSAHHASVTDQSNNIDFLKHIIDKETKVLISQNDNKLFSGTPTFKTESMQNLINAGVGETNIYTTQDHGDILIELDNTPDCLIINETRSTAIINGNWKNLNSNTVATNHSKNYNNINFRKYFA